jgi:signal transduction histidine kinase
MSILEPSVAPSGFGCAHCDAIALENQRLREELQARMDELNASRRRIVAACDDERRRLERNLHDGAQQRLVALSMQLRLIQADIRKDPAAAEALVTTATDELARSLEELRELARGIHPAVLHCGLQSALESLAARSPVRTTVHCGEIARLPEQVELAAYFVVCESLANVGKYAGASIATVTVTRSRGRLRVAVADDGAGGADPLAGSGLRGLADRVEALNGRLSLSSPAGLGTTVVAEIPLAPLAAR